MAFSEFSTETLSVHIFLTPLKHYGSIHLHSSGASLPWWDTVHKKSSLKKKKRKEGRERGCFSAQLIIQASTGNFCCKFEKEMLDHIALGFRTAYSTVIGNHCLEMLLLFLFLSFLNPGAI